MANLINKRECHLTMSVLTCVFSGLLIIASIEGNPLFAAEPDLDAQRLELAKKDIAMYGSHIPASAQAAILEQRVILGMSPYEARLAAGSYSFVVQADPAVWPPGADPNVVINRQSIQPDNSKIRLLFQTSTQFPTDGKSTFAVYFENGQAVKIEKIEKIEK